MKEWTIEREEEQMTRPVKGGGCYERKKRENEFAVGADECNTSVLVVEAG
jgi:hypothetical protein